jgi:hypothetical protein
VRSTGGFVGYEHQKLAAVVAAGQHRAGERVWKVASECRLSTLV